MHAYDAAPDLLDKELVLEFFWDFSVFECAMKNEGFLREGRRGEALPDWHQFRESIEGEFERVEAPGFGEAVAELKKHSPCQQVVENNRLAWREIRRGEDESEESYVLRLLSTARNNLFHGAKYPGRAIDEIAANKDILRAALTVLRACFELHPGIAARCSRVA